MDKMEKTPEGVQSTTCPAAAVGCRELIKSGCKPEPYADAKMPNSLAQHSVSAVDYVRVKTRLIEAPCEKLISNGVLVN